MASPVVYGPRYSTYTRSVLLALEEKGVACEVREVDIFKGENQSPEHLARQPFGKVPAFSHDGFDLYETVPILHYVDEVFEGPRLTPGDARGRARMHQVMSIVDAYGYAAFVTNIFIPRAVVPMMGGDSDEAAIAAALPQAARCVQALERILGDNAFVAGKSVSLADLHLAPVYDYFAQTPEGQKTLQDAPALRRWWDGMKVRESVEKTRPKLG